MVSFPFQSVFSISTPMYVLLALRLIGSGLGPNLLVKV